MLAAADVPSKQIELVALREAQAKRERCAGNQTRNVAMSSAAQSAQVFSEARPAYANGKQTELYNGMKDYVSSWGRAWALLLEKSCTMRGTAVATPCTYAVGGV